MSAFDYTSVRPVPPTKRTYIAAMSFTDKKTGEDYAWDAVVTEYEDGTLMINADENMPAEVIAWLESKQGE